MFVVMTCCSCSGQLKITTELIVSEN